MHEAHTIQDSTPLDLFKSNYSVTSLKVFEDSVYVYICLASVTSTRNVTIYRIKKADYTVKYIVDAYGSTSFITEFKYEPTTGYLYAFTRHATLPTSAKPFRVVKNYLKTNLATSNGKQFDIGTTPTGGSDHHAISGTFKADGTEVVTCIGDSDSTGTSLSFILLKHVAPALTGLVQKAYEGVDQNSRYTSKSPSQF